MVDPIRNAVWYIESHFAQPISLDEIAEASGLSRFHLSRTFAQITGRSISGYLRGRRLTQAAQVLAQGAPDIISVALDVGYGSHEAFTRAFRDFFGITPEEVRAERNVDNLPLVEPYIMSAVSLASLSPPTFREEGPFLFAGLREFRTFEERSGIPAQWQRFGPHMGHMPGRVGGDAFGVCLSPANGAEGFDYLTAVAVRSLDALTEGLSGVRLSRRRYAIFVHDDHVSKIGATCAAIFGQWQQNAALQLEHEPLFLIEHYLSAFDPDSGRGGIEVWVPLKE